MQEETNQTPHKPLHNNQPHTGTEQTPPVQPNSFIGSIYCYVLLLLIVLSIIVGFSIYLAERGKVIRINIQDLTIPQPFVENNEFRSFTLDNGLKVILVKSNDGMENEYAALTVGVGSQTDPLDFCGFTHLIEHLLFTGSKNFPEDNYIEKVVNKYNGENNGVTKSFTTSYYYKIGPGGMSEFAEVLVDAVAFPLFDEERIMKELNNVNSEISMRMTFNKNLGYYKMLKKIGNPKARIFRDGFANIDAAKQDFEALQKKLLAFHKQYYSANIMSLAMITDNDLDPLEDLVRKHFAQIPNKNIERPTYQDIQDDLYEPPFLPESMGNVFYLQGFSEPSKFFLFFQVPAERGKMFFHPLEYFSFFLNYYSKGSFKDRLTRKGYISDFQDELALQDYKQAVYLIEFQLTELGESHISDIIVDFFSFVEFLRQLDITPQLFKEISNFSKFSFLFNISSEFMMFEQVEQDNFERVLDFSEKILNFGPDQVLTANQIWDGFNPKHYREVLDEIRPTKTVFMYQSEKFKKVGDPDVQLWNADDINGVKERLQKAKAAGKKKVEEANDGSRTLHTKLTTHPNTLLKPSTQNSPITNRFNRKLRETQHLVTEIQAINKLLAKNHTQDSQKLKKSAQILRERLLKSTFYAAFFDEAIKSNQLQFRLDFDNNCMFEYAKVPLDLWKQFNQQIKSNHKDFDPIGSFGFKEEARYDMISKCKVPEIISESKSDNGTAQKPRLSLQKLYTTLFDTGSSDSLKKDKMMLIRALLIYKICLIDDFENDDLELKPNKVFDSSRLKVFHKLYRKTLQPKFAVKIMQENDFLAHNLSQGSARNKQKFYVKISMLTLYMKSLFNLDDHKAFAKGNDFSIGTSGYAINYVFMGISNGLPLFIRDIIARMDALARPETYDIAILNNLKELVANNYSSFNTLTSLQAATYYLDLIIDQLEIDYRSPKAQAQIRQWVDSTTPQELATLYQKIQQNNRLTVLFVGNVSEEDVLLHAQAIQQQFLKDLAPSEAKTMRKQTEQRRKEIQKLQDHGFDSPQAQHNHNHKSHETALVPNTKEIQQERDNINHILNNILLRFRNGPKHYMIRQSNIDPADNNNVYLTYFRTSKFSTRVNIITSMLGHWLRNFVFDKLRNQMNLGYVAHASTREYYYRSGIIIILQGESFRPSEIESVVEDTVREFIDLVKAKSNEEIEQLKDLIVERYTEFTNSLSDVTAREWDFIHEAYILGEKGDYVKEAKQVNLQDIVEFAEDMFVTTQKRVTIELFAHGASQEEREFELSQSKALGEKEYDIVSLDEMLAIREESVSQMMRAMKKTRY